MNPAEVHLKDEVGPAVRALATVLIWRALEFLPPDVNGLPAEAAKELVTAVTSVAAVSMFVNGLIRGPRFLVLWDQDGAPMKKVVGPIVLPPNAPLFVRLRVMYAESRWVARRARRRLRETSCSIDIEVSQPKALKHCSVDRQIRGEKVLALPAKGGFRLAIPSRLADGELGAALVEIDPILEPGLPLDVSLKVKIVGDGLKWSRVRMRASTSVETIRLSIRP